MTVMTKHIARKRFGQHFLSDAGIIDAIVRAIDPQPGQPMVEIGPGLAALTQPLVERLGHLTGELGRFGQFAALRQQLEEAKAENDAIRATGWQEVEKMQQRLANAEAQEAVAWGIPR